MNQREILGFNAKITPIKPLNEEMTLCKCYVMALGKNRNYSHITQEAVDDALPTIYNIPVVGHVYVDDDGEYHMGGHDMTIVKDSDGRLKFKSLCVPFGVVPQQDNIHYEEIIDSNGNKSIYQVADIILWTGRYPDLYKAVYDDDIYFGQSMEINVKAYEPLADDSKYTDIKKFAYSALCLLGKSDDPEYHVEPCFPASRVEPYHFSFDDSTFDEMMQEFKAELSECFSAINIEKGGEERVTTEVLNSVSSECSLDNEDKDFELTEEIAEDELRENLTKSDEVAQFSSEDENGEDDIPSNDEEKDEEIDQDDTQVPDEDVQEENEQDVEETVEQPQEEQASLETENEEFSAVDNSMSYCEKLDALCNAANAISQHANDMMISYWVCDCDDTYAYLTEFKYENGVSGERKCRVGYKIENGVAEFVGEFETVYSRYLTELEIAELEKLKADYEELKSFQEKRLEDDRIKEYDDVVSEFSDLADNEEFSLVVKDKMSFETAEALREKCFAIRGRATVVSTTKKPEMKIAIDFAETKPEVYGGFFSKYPPKKVEIK